MAGDRAFPLATLAASHCKGSSFGIALSTDLPYCEGSDCMSHGQRAVTCASQDLLISNVVIPPSYAEVTRGTVNPGFLGWAEQKREIRFSQLRLAEVSGVAPELSSPVSLLSALSNLC